MLCGVGCVIKYYIGHAVDKTISNRTGGGGVVTAMLINALNQGLITEAILVKNSAPLPIRARCTTASDIMSCSGSKYIYRPFVPEGLSNRSAVVGLSCEFNKKPVPFYKVGLFTGLCCGEKAYDELFQILGIRKKDIVQHRFREKKKNIIVLRNGKEITYPTSWWLSYAYSCENSNLTPRPSCIRCRDNTNHHSDISVGDWSFGKSVVLIRNERGQELFDSAIWNEYIQINAITELEFIKKKTNSRSYVQKEIKGGFAL